MQYTTLGKRTGLKVSVLGFGAMRLPMKGQEVDRDKSTPMIHRAFELGLNYIDSAVFYCNGDSQTAVGEALKGWRDKVTVSTKNHSYGRKDYDTWRRNFEDSLRKLDVEYIDIYNLHGLAWDRFVENVDGKGGSYEWMARAKDEGLIRHIGFSFHDKPEALEKLARTGMFDVVTCQYNLLDRANEKAMKVAAQQGMGVVVMGPVGGGRLGAPSDQLRKLIPGAASVPEVALRFVIANPSVSIALSGMETIEQVEENCRAAKTAPLSKAEKQSVERVLKRYKKLADLYCTGCNYCMPCPVGVDIPWMFTNLNTMKVYGLESQAKRQYARSSNRATLCIACGKCMPKCPQGIDIIGQLRETTRRLDDNYGKLAVRLEPGKITGFSNNAKGRKLQLAGKVSLANISDQPVEVEMTFEPGKAVKISPTGRAARLDAFGRKRVGVTIETTAPAGTGKPIDTGLKVASDSKCVVGGAELNVAIALPGGEKALAKAPKISLTPNAKGVKITPKVKQTHGAKVAFAYDAKALYARAWLTDDLAFPPSPTIGMHSADRLEMNFNLENLARPRGNGPVALSWRLWVSPPTADGTCYRWVSNQWTSSDKAFDVLSARKSAKGVTITLRIPWKNISCPAGKAGAALRLGLNHISYSRQGKLNYKGHWTTEDGWVLLAPWRAGRTGSRPSTLDLS